MFRNMVCSLSIPKGFRNYTIVHLEILNIVVALKVWDSLWKDHIIEVKCDNMAVVEVLNTGRARDLMLATSARNIWLLIFRNGATSNKSGEYSNSFVLHGIFTPKGPSEMNEFHCLSKLCTSMPPYPSNHKKNYHHPNVTTDPFHL